MTQVKLKPFHTAEEDLLISEWSIPLECSFLYVCLPRQPLIWKWSQGIFCPIGNLHTWLLSDQRLRAASRRHSTTCWEPPGYLSLSAGETVGLRVVGWRKNVRVLGRSSCCILRSNVVNCSCVDLCSIDIHPDWPLTFIAWFMCVWHVNKFDCINIHTKYIYIYRGIYMRLILPR